MLAGEFGVDAVLGHPFAPALLKHIDIPASGLFAGGIDIAGIKMALPASRLFEIA